MMTETQWREVIEKNNYSLARLFLLLYGDNMETDSEKDDFIESSFLYEFTPNVGEFKEDCFDVGALTIGEPRAFKLVRLLFFAYSNMNFQIVSAFNSEPILLHLYKALYIHNLLIYEMNSYKSGQRMSKNKDESVAYLNEKMRATFSEAFTLFKNLELDLINPIEVISCLEESAEGQVFISKILKNVLQKSINQVPQEIEEQYLEKIEEVNTGKKQLQAYLYQAQGYRRAEIAKKLKWKDNKKNMSNVSNQISKGKELAQKYKLPGLEKYTPRI